ncbi:MAG: dihydroneopterin aldolase [Burkholderiaceae bacterium]|nr:dihydroneopterin aldolase [Burkholderiaceae bacterium]
MISALLDPRLAGCRRVFLRNYVVDANIGVHAHERNGAQHVVFNIDVFIPLEFCTPRADRIQEVVDYDFVRVAIQRRIGQGHINLQETLIDDVAQALLAHPAVRAVRISSEKPDVYEDVDAVGVEVVRFKAGA